MSHTCLCLPSRSWYSMHVFVHVRWCTLVCYHTENPDRNELKLGIAIVLVLCRSLLIFHGFKRSRVRVMVRGRNSWHRFASPESAHCFSFLILLWMTKHTWLCTRTIERQLVRFELYTTRATTVRGQTYSCVWAEERRRRFVLRSRQTTRPTILSWSSWCVTAGTSIRPCVPTSPPSAAGCCSSTEESTTQSA